MPHDIGKIGVSGAILDRSGCQSTEEFAAINEHLPRGHQLISGIRSLHRKLSGARLHHERSAGSGYPNDPCDDTIPQEARNIAVADVYDGLTSSRAYREDPPPTAALAIIATDAELDARCVRILPAKGLASGIATFDRPACPQAFAVAQARITRSARL